MKDNLIAKGIKLDIVVANVGDGRSVSDSVPNNQNWEESWAKNFNSALYTSRAFVPMLEEKEGSLLFISSIAGVEAIGAPINYSTAKSALIAFSKNLSKKLAGRVRVNTIAPGNINFPGSSWEEKIKADEKDSKKKVTKKPTKKPLKKKAKPEGDKKSADTKKADGRKPKQRNKKDEKNSQVKKKESKTKADKEIKTSDSKKTSSKTKKSSKANNDKVLPWEDIVPPK